MPRYVRCSLSRVFGNVFVLVAASLMLLDYYTVVEHWRHHTLFLLAYHVLVVLLAWSFVQTMITDPGQVPPYWGFAMGDSELKRRRYCLMCHVFKPERCHHCSACNRCVLNMDHHCPWVNNCIGFYNRKFFMLLLCYVFLTTWYTAVAMFPACRDIVLAFQERPTLDRLWPFVVVGVYAGNLALAVAISMFLRFHFSLVLANRTTIDTMDKSKKPTEVLAKQFTKGLYLNWCQVFGRNPFMWPIPAMSRSGKPLGDGVSWRPDPVVTTSEEPDLVEARGKQAAQLPSLVVSQLSPSQKSLRSSNLPTESGPQSPRPTLERKNDDLTKT